MHHVMTSMLHVMTSMLHVMISVLRVMIHQHDVMIHQHDVMIHQHRVMIHQHDVMIHQHHVSLTEVFTRFSSPKLQKFSTAIIHYLHDLLIMARNQGSFVAAITGRVPFRPLSGFIVTPYI